MDIVKILPQEEIDLLRSYLNSYSDGGYINEDNMCYFLRYWRQNKERFYRMFKNNFILKKDVYFEKDTKSLNYEMEVMLYTPIVRRFCKEFQREVSQFSMILRDFVEDENMLVNNEYCGPSIVIPGAYTQNGRPLQVNSGCKVVKMIGKVSKAMGIEVKVRVCSKCGEIDGVGDKCHCGGDIKEIDAYEHFRQAHSQILNQKKIKGKMCLSIHPLDFLTMSDNNCGWTSCMSWMEEYGDYRLGTIEMMNSDCVVMAYIEASDPMDVCGMPWNNKRWRQLYIVTPELILGNKQYPYANDDLQGAAIKWIRELASSTMGYGPYPEETSVIINGSNNWIDGDKKVRFHLHSDYMYNDIYDDRMAYVASTYFKDGDTYRYNFSGPAVCCQCGGVIEYGEAEAHRVLCNTCCGRWRCERCGDWYEEGYDPAYYVGDYVYCDWCYHNELSRCELCDDHYEQSDVKHVYIQMVDAKDTEIIQYFNYNYYVAICDNCIADKSYEEMFGPIYEVTDMWGHRRRAFDIKNITDEGLELGDLGYSNMEFLKSVRDANSVEDRLALIRKKLY